MGGATPQEVRVLVSWVHPGADGSSGGKHRSEGIFLSGLLAKAEAGKKPEVDPFLLRYLILIPN
jgi:hypothetical protein